MTRLLLIVLLLYVLYRLIVKPARRERVSRRAAGGELDDILVKDPYCETHFPKREGVHLRLKGSDFLFCSERCRDRFVAMHEKKT